LPDIDPVDMISELVLELERTLVSALKQRPRDRKKGEGYIETEIVEVVEVEEDKSRDRMKVKRMSDYRQEWEVMGMWVEPK
jgi:hypothetical protein